MDGRIDRVWCEDREERCDVCRKDDGVMEEAKALREAYEEGIYSQEQGEQEQEQEEYEREQQAYE